MQALTWLTNLPTVIRIKNDVTMIVSRRLWLNYRQLYEQQHRLIQPSINRTGSKSKSDDDKPWPRNVILTGYVVASIVVPYSIGWYLSMNASIRKIVESYIPGFEDILRSHFGHEEYVPYQDRREGLLKLPPRRLEDEFPTVVRKQQDIIETHLNSQISLKIHEIDSGQVISTTEVTLPGSMLATASQLLPNGNSKDVAIDFLDDENVSQDTSYDISPSMNSMFDTSIYSHWFYQPPKPTTSNSESRKVSSRNTTVYDNDISRLEYLIQTLEHDIRDINSTRDIDDMQQELLRYKSELRSLRWKKRLSGWW
jgi:hypothetical protein